jgi:phosphoenolpyruvate carboxylase
MPAAAQNGRMRVTEQGEVISFRYGLDGLAHRHIEQLVSALLLNTCEAPPAADTPASAEAVELLDDIAATSRRAYRDLIDHPDFWPWYATVTPIEHISRLPMTSRPSSRKSGSDVAFDDLRAIPWVFAWTQTRYNVPGWFGLGGPLQQAAASKRLGLLRRLYHDWPFFHALIENAEREMARARLEIAEEYAGLAPDDSGAEFHKLIASDFAAARAAILAITGQESLLNGSPVIQKSIRLRNPYTDVLNLIQVELLRRYRAACQEEREADVATIAALLFLSLNGLAAAMQTTG